MVPLVLNHGQVSPIPTNPALGHVVEYPEVREYLVSGPGQCHDPGNPLPLHDHWAFGALLRLPGCKVHLGTESRGFTAGVERLRSK